MKWLKTETVFLKGARWGMVKNSKVVTRYHVDSAGETNLKVAWRRLRNGDELRVSMPNATRTYVRTPEGWTY